MLTLSLLLVTPRAPRSTLFPYTTLFRSGIKHAVHELDLVSELLVRLGPDFRVFCGLESLSLPMLALGAAGVMNAVGKDRKSTRLNSSHANISYAVFCLKKKRALTA